MSWKNTFSKGDRAFLIVDTNKNVVIRLYKVNKVDKGPVRALKEVQKARRPHKLSTIKTAPRCHSIGRTIVASGSTKIVDTASLAVVVYPEEPGSLKLTSCNLHVSMVDPNQMPTIAEDPRLGPALRGGVRVLSIES